MRNLLKFILLFIFISGLKYETKAVTARPTVSADGAILMDAATGKILYSKNIDIAYPPASTTKIMTALLTLENCNMEDKVVVGKNPPKTEGNNIALFEGEEFSVEDMLYALINESANDCANALAEHISGSVEGFAQKMNERAQELGCKNTNFVNPNGLYDKNHRTSARDLAIIMKELVNDDRFSIIATTNSYFIQPTNKTPRERSIYNHNRLLIKNSGYYYEYCEGGKTGYTIQSKHSYVASAKKDGHRLIVALIHDSQKTFYKDTIALFNYGFSNYKLEKMYSRGEMIHGDYGDGSQLSLAIGEDFYYVRNNEDKEIPRLNFNFDYKSIKELKKGENLTIADIMLNGTNIGNVPIISLTDYKMSSQEESVERVFKNISSMSNSIANNKIISNKYVRSGAYALIAITILIGIIKAKG